MQQSNQFGTSPQHLPCGPTFWPAAVDAIIGAASVSWGHLVLVQSGWQAQCLTRAFASRCQKSGTPIALPEIRVLGDWIAQTAALLGCALDDLARVALVADALQGAGAWVRQAAPNTGSRIRLAKALIASADELLWARALSGQHQQLQLRALGNAVDAEIALVEKIADVLSDSMNPVHALRACLQTLGPRPVTLLTIDADPQLPWRFAAAQLGAQALWLMPDYAAAKGSLGGVFAQWTHPHMEANADVSRIASTAQARFAGSIEREAQYAATAVLDALKDPQQCVSIVPLDRRVARRVHALLARAQVPVNDSAGWRLITTTAATSVARWFDWLLHERVTDLLDWWAQPAVASAFALSQEARVLIEQTARDVNVVQGAQALRVALEKRREQQDKPIFLEATAHLDVLASHAKALSSTQSAAEFATRIQHLLQPLMSVLQKDAAGQRVVAAIALFETLLTAAPQTLADFWALLNAQMEQEFFAQPQLQARVSIETLDAAAFSQADLVLILGASRKRLPSFADDLVLLPPAMRSALALPVPDDGSGAFATLLLTARRVLLTFTAADSERAQFEASPWLVQLMLSLPKDKAQPWQPLPAVAMQRALSYASVFAPAPYATGHMPEQLTASAFEDLIACPYRFFALRILGLRALDALSEQLDRSDYGQLAHRLLAWLHANWPDLSSTEDPDVLSTARQWLQQLRGTSPMERTQRSAFAAMIARWLPQYLLWMRQREAQGWRVSGFELSLQQTIEIGPSIVQLRGRIDHIEKHRDGKIAVYDYKTQGEQTVKQLAQEPLEAVQLAFYGALLDEGADELGYVSLSSDKAQAVAVQGDIGDLIQTVRDALVARMENLHEGQPLPANGVQTACARCNAYGVCQRGYRA